MPPAPRPDRTTTRWRTRPPGGTWGRKASCSTADATARPVRGRTDHTDRHLLRPGTGRRGPPRPGGMVPSGNSTTTPAPSDDPIDRSASSVRGVARPRRESPTHPRNRRTGCPGGERTSSAAQCEELAEARAEGGLDDPGCGPAAGDRQECRSGRSRRARPAGTTRVPNRAMSATWASVSTFWTSVGRPPTPRSRTGRRPTNDGMPAFRPLMVLTTADSWPARNRSGATTMSTGHGSSAGPLVVHRCAGSSARRRPAARARRPAGAEGRRGDGGSVQDEMGTVVDRYRSLPLAGSPSAPLATTTGFRPPRPPPPATSSPPGTMRHRDRGGRCGRARP